MGFITTTDEHIASGGTISGDLTIAGDLTVNGGGDFAYSEVLTGDMIIDQNTNATALTVDAENTSATGVDMIFGAMDSGYGLRVRTGSADAALTTGTLLDVYSKDSDTGTRNLMRIVNDDGNATGTTALKIQQDSTGPALVTVGGDVGIGTTSPSCLVEIQGGLTTKGAVLTLSTKEPSVVANDVLGRINFQAPLDTGADSDLIGSSIHALATDTFSDTVNATDLIFSTGASETATEKMRIASTGAITLAGTLTVNGTNTTIANATNPYLYINDTNAGAAIFQQSGNDTRIGSDSNTQVLFVQSNATAMTISTDKYLGIGTSSPATNLHVKTTAGNHGIEIESDSAAVLTFDHAGNDEARILFKEADTTEGSIIYTSTGTDTMQFKVGSNGLRFKLDANSRMSLSNNDTGTSSTVFGYLAGMPGHANALGNIFIGQEAGENVGSSDTDGNVMIGYRAGRGTFTDATDHNVGIGYTALNVLTSGHGNVAMGSGAGIAIQDAESNIAIGRNALGQVVSSNQSIAIGFNSGYGLTTGANNTVIGAEALYNSADIDRAVVIGKNAIYAGNATAASDGAIAIGYDSLRDLTSAGPNVAIGYEALHDCTTANRCVGIGYQALDAITTGASGTGHCTAVGYAALGAATGKSNSGFGMGAGDTISTGSNNTCMGSESNVSASGAVNQTAIGFQTTGVADNSVTLGNADVTRVNMSSDGAAVMYADGTINTSDKRFKENIEDTDLGLSFINSLRPVKYNFIENKHDDKTKYGIIAQEVVEVLNKTGNEDFAGIKDDNKEKLGADYIQFIAPLMKAVQELTAKVEALEKNN